MSKRNQIRILVLVLANVVLLARIVYSGFNRDVQVRVPPLDERQVVLRDTLNANTCERAVWLAHQPYATQIGAAEGTIPAYHATLIATAVLTNHYGTDITAGSTSTAPMLLQADVFNQERTIWGQLWLPEDDDTDRGTVVYIDAHAAVPLLVFTDVGVQDTAHPSCLQPTAPTPVATHYRRFAPFVWGTALMLISFGIVLDYRDRISRLTLRKRR